MDEKEYEPKSPMEEVQERLKSISEIIRKMEEGDRLKHLRMEFDKREVTDFFDRNYPNAVPDRPWNLVFYGLSGPIYPGKIRALIYEYGIQFVLAFMKFLESREEYEACKLIKESVEEHNHATGEDLPTDI